MRQVGLRECQAEQMGWGEAQDRKPVFLRNGCRADGLLGTRVRKSNCAKEDIHASQGFGLSSVQQEPLLAPEQVCTVCETRGCVVLAGCHCVMS